MNSPGFHFQLVDMTNFFVPPCFLNGEELGNCSNIILVFTVFEKRIHYFRNMGEETFFREITGCLLYRTERNLTDRYRDLICQYALVTMLMKEKIINNYSPKWR